jgi:hypothetical protein
MDERHQARNRGRRRIRTMPDAGRGRGRNAPLWKGRSAPNSARTDVRA